MTVRSIPLEPSRSAWRFFPAWVVGVMALVVAVNAGMVWSALATFPGAVDAHAFDTGNNYNAILAQVEREAALGWQVEARLDGRTVSIGLRDKAGQPLAGAAVTATAHQALGPDETTRLSFAAAGGRYVAQQALPSAGQWDVDIVAARDGQTTHQTRRLALR